MPLGLYVKNTGKRIQSSALVASGADALFDAVLSLSVLASAHIEIDENLDASAIVLSPILMCRIEYYIPPANRLDGRKYNNRQRINTAVNERLTGYANIIVFNLRSIWKIVAIQSIRTPQIPIVVRIAGSTEIPKPRRYPDIFSYSKLNKYAIVIIANRSYPVCITCGDVLKMPMSVFPKVNAAPSVML